MSIDSVSGKVVLYVVNDFSYFRAHREALAAAVAGMGCRVAVMAGNCEAGDARDGDSFTLIPVKIRRQNLSVSDDLAFARTVRHWARVNQPDIIHMITIKPILFGTLGMLLPTALTDFRLIWTMPGLGKIYEPGTRPVHRLRKWLTSRGLTFAARWSDATITVENEGDRQRLIDHNAAPQERIEVVDGTGLDLDHFSPPEDREDGPLIFVMATRLLKAKGVGEYVAAARRMHGLGTKARFLLAGLTDPDNPDAYDPRLIEEAAAEGVIEWLGAVNQDAMPALLRKCDVFCLPTKLQEGLPRSLMEAAACGCALIAPDQVPIRKFLIDGKTGWLIGKARKHELEAAIEAAALDPDKVRQMGAAAAEQIRLLPVSDTKVIAKFSKLYGLDDG